MELNQTTAVITGSSGRLGFWIAKALAQAGCNCICHYHRNRDVAEQLVAEIRQMSAKAVAVGADLTKPQQIETLFAGQADFARPRILINSAAVFSRQPLDDMTFQQAQSVLNLNLTAPILASQVFAKIVSAEFDSTQTVAGKIINIADIGGIRPWAGSVLYCSSKAGLIGATKALAKELAPGICVNAIAPGLITWPSDFDESAKSRQLSFIPLRRIGEPAEVTEAIIFLLKSDYITGQVLNVDGGRCI